MDVIASYSNGHTIAPPQSQNPTSSKSPAKAKQVGGNHYKDMAIQPVDYILANNIGFVEGCVIKYVSRWKSKGGIEDLKKARHFLDILIERGGTD